MHDSTYWAKGVFGLFCKIFRKIHNKTVQVENRSGGAGGRGGVGVAKKVNTGGGAGGDLSAVRQLPILMAVAVTQLSPWM